MAKSKARTSRGKARKTGVRRTAEKTADQVAQEVYAYAQVVMDAVSTPLLLLDEDLRIASANRAFYKTFQISSRKTEKKLLSELGRGEWNAPEITNVLRGVLTEGTAVEGLEIGHTFPRIGPKVLLLSVHRVDGCGTPTRKLLLAIEDITEQRQTEDALADVRFRIETRFAQLPILAYNIGFDGKILDCNDAVLSTLGYDNKEEIVGRPLIPTIYAPSSRKKAKQLLAKWKREGALRNEEIQVITKQGKVLDVLLNVSTVFDRNGKPLHSFSTQLDITARKKAEEALRDSETVLKQAQHLAQVGSWTWNLKDDVFRMSPELSRIYGTQECRHGTDIEDVIDECIHPDDRGYIHEARQIASLGGEGGPLTYRIIRPDAQVRWVTSTKPGVSRVGEDGEPEVLVGAVQDITERKRADEELQKRTRELRERVKELDCLYQALILMAEMDKPFDEIMQAVADLIPSGWQYPEITCVRITLPGRQFATGAFKETAWGQSAEIRISGKAVGSVEVYYLEKSPDLDEGPFSREERNLLDTLAGEIGKFADRRRARRSLRESEEKFRALAENAPDVISRLDSQGRFVYANPAIKAFGVSSPQDVIGKTPEEAALPEPLSNLLNKVVRKVSGTGRTDTAELSLPIAGGERFYRVTVVPELSRHGTLRTLLTVASDITEMKEAEEITRRDKATLERLVKQRTGELMEAYQKLADAKRLSDIGTLAATVAHELRNPLGVIQTAIFNISRKRKEPSLDKHLANIEKKILESDQIISNLLRYSRIKAPQYEEAGIYDILNESIDSARSRFSKQKVSVRKDLEAVKDKIVELDAVQIREVLDNTLNNAYQALADGEGEIEVAAGFGPNQTVITRIKDDGVGLDKADLDRVFEPFFTKKSRGTGLGLTICRELVNLHGGAIRIESEKGAGTTVTISLPARRPER